VIKTDHPNFFKTSANVVIHHDEQQRQAILKERQDFFERKQLQDQINNMSDELRHIKDLLNQLTSKDK